MTTNQKTIAQHNDRFRQTFIGGSVLITPGVSALAPHLVSHIVELVQGFDSFNETNDSYAEHDFGAIEIEDAPLVFWKIDYLNNDLTEGSPDPADNSVTTRVLTIYLASEH